MELLKIILISIITLVLNIILKEIKPEISLFVNITGAILVLLICFDTLAETISEFKAILNKLNVDSDIFKILIKIVGIGYLVEFSASLCKDFNNGLMADKIMFAGKVLIFALSLPIFKSIIDIITGLL